MILGGSRPELSVYHFGDELEDFVGEHDHFDERGEAGHLIWFSQDTAVRERSDAHGSLRSVRGMFIAFQGKAHKKGARRREIGRHRPWVT